MRIFGTAFLLVLLSISTKAARTNENSNPCSLKCSNGNDNLFKPGQKYTFSYQAESNLKTANDLYDTTGVMIKAKVTITGLSNCEMKLSMSEVKFFDKISKDGNTFRESPNSSKMKSILELNEVFFTSENNEVKSVCLDKDEPIWSENIKKTVIDSLANQGIQTKELSYKKTSHGKCYIQSSEQNKLVTNEMSVKFQYDVKSCNNAVIQKSIFGDLSQMALFENSKVSCQYLYKSDSKLHSVQCIEEYQTSKLKQNDNQLIVKIQTNLIKEYQESTDDKKFSNKNLIKTGIEQTEDEVQSQETTYITVKQTLKEICVQQTSSNLSKVPKLFMKLVNQLKDLDSKEFKELYLEVLKTDICPEKSLEMRSLFYDASGFVSTPASTSVMVELIKNNRISAFDQNVWLTSLSFMQQTPTLEMLKELESLISVENPNIPTYLGISAVTNLFCKDNYKLCLEDPTISNIISKFLQNLNNDCSIPKDASKDFTSKIQISLKAIGNLKFYPENVIQILNKCISTNKNELSVRISALEVMKHMDCKNDRTEAMKILLNNENDSELRINAYLTVMGCPDVNTLFKVREILSQEKVNQVGSFIWTHLTNIKESSDTLKSKIKELLDDVNFKKEFDISKLKFSRNIEKTFQSNNMGLTIDSNVIFSEKSFIPKSVSLNTTTSIFGRTTNFLEMSARLEGLEEMLFKLFGPEGYMKKTSNVQDSLDLLKILNEMSGNMNIKLYGQQISFVELIRGSLSSIKKYNIIEEIMNWSQDKTFELNKNLQLIDKTVVLPTLLGFPLEFKLQGSVSMNIKIKSKLDIAGLVSWPISFNIDNYISPNINAELYSDIVLKAPYSNYGMRLNIKSGTNTELKAKIFAKNNEEFSIKFDTLKTKQEIISVEGNTYVIHQNKKIIQLQDKMKNYNLCTSETMVRFVGVKVCGEAKLLDTSIRKNALVFAPFSLNLFIEKQDTQTGYILQAFSKSSSFISKTGNLMTNRNIKFEFNTPNSNKYNRRFYGELGMDFKNQNLKFEFVTPWSEAFLLAKFKFTEDEKKLQFSLKINKRDIIEILVEHTQQYSSKRKITKGLLSVNALNLTPIKTNWVLDITDDEYLLNLFSKGLMKDDNQLKIKVLKVKSTRQLSLFNKFEISGFYNSYFGNGKISGIASENYYGHRWDVKLNHKSKTSKEYQMIFRHKTEDKSSKNLNKFFLTTTFSYGEKAENFVNLKTENEFSEKHFRTSLKASYGRKETENMKPFEEELSMHLYGGNTWKNDDKHYAEGSLSFKFPKRNINYEGRYNSEIGKRLFKLSLALDQEQQSKINLKINYDQPKLYLKDTVLDMTFSLPNHNVDVKWNLMEIDVNKFKYTLESKYNNYDMKIDGIQTQISKLDHDSYITIQMPRIDSLPKDLKIKLRINLVDLAKAKIQGEIEIPNSNYRYLIDTQFSFTPQNFLQISSSENNSVLKYSIELSNRQKTVKSKFIFTCNPEEFQTLFNMNFNKNSNLDDQIEFDIHALHKNPVYKQFNSVAKIAVRYPGNSHSIGFKSEFKYTEMVAQIDIIWNKNQRIAITSTYELDKSWTQKGIIGSLTIKTPFIGYEQIHFGINAVGQLRYRKISFEYKWGLNKKILFDIIIQPRSSSDFSLNSKLITPFSGWNLITFQAKHMHSPNSINTHCSIEIGPVKKYQIKFDAINNSEGKNRDLMANLLLESGIYPSFKMGILHKDNSVHYKSQFDAVWMKTQSINVKSDISYQLEDYELITKGTIEMFSTIELVKQMKMIWSTENRDSQFSNFIHLLVNTKNIFQTSIKGFYEKEQEMFKMEFNGDATILNSKSVKIANNLVYETTPSSIQHRFSIGQDTNSIYSHNLIATKKSLIMKILIPNSEFKTIEVEIKSNSDGKTFSEVDFIKIGDKFLFKLKKHSVINKKNFEEMDLKSKMDFYSDYTSIKSLELITEIEMKVQSIKIQSKLKSESNVIATISAKGSHENGQIKYKLLINSQFEMMRLINLEFEKTFKEFDGSLNCNFDLSINKILHFNSKTTIQGNQLIKIDLLIKYRNYVKYLKLKHAKHLLGYEHLFDTNIFGDKIKFTNTIISRGGMSLQTKLQANFPFFKSLEIFGRFSKEKEFKIIYLMPLDSKENLKIKFTFSNLNGLNKLNFELVTYLKAELKINLKQKKTIEFDFEMNPNNLISEIKLNFEIGENTLKHFAQLKVIIEGKKLTIENKIEKVKSNYLLIESNIKTNFKNFNNYTLNFEYKLQPTKFSFDFKGIINEKFIKLSTNLESSSEMKIQLKIETSFPLLKEIDFELKQKQNSLLTQVAHKCKAIIKSNERSFKFQNEIEWSGYNYVKVELMLDSKLSNNSYLIQPISLKFIHQFHRNVLKENFQLNLSNEKLFKIQLEIPFNRKFKSLFEFELSYQNFKQFSIDFSINFSENEEKSISLKVLQNNKIFINSELNYKNDNKRVLVTADLETIGNYKTFFQIESLENYFGNKILKIKFTNSKLKVPIIFVGKFNFEKKELSLSVTGTTDQQLSIYGQISKAQTFAKIKYGNHEFNFEVLLDKNIGIKLIQTTLSSLVNVNFEFIRSEKNFKLSGKYEKHYLKMICDYKGEFDIDLNILNIISTVKFNLISSLTDSKYKIEGKTNLNKWKQFKTELELYRSSQENKLKYYFNKENQEILNFNIEMKIKKSISGTYKSIFKLIKSGEFQFNYEKFPKKLALKFTGENAASQSINVEYNLDETSFKGELSSPFEWFRKVSIGGELSKSTNEIKGKFNINHNKLNKQIEGEFSMEIKFNLFKINAKTPFSFPYNEFSLKRETSDSMTIIELADIEKKLLTYKFTSVSKAKFDIDLSLIIPKSLLDLSLNCKSNIDFENSTKKIKFSLTSNQFSNTKFDINLNFIQHEYKMQFFHPLKDGQFEFKVLQFQESGKQIEITTQYGSIKHEAEIVYEIKNPNDIYFKSVAKCHSHFTSPASFEINYKHKFDIPSNFNIDSQFKFNDKTVFYNTISWKYQSDKSFILLGKNILSPNVREYESKFELSNKRGEIVELIVSAAEILQEEINIRLVRKEENFELTVKSPFELIKSVNINIRKEQKVNTWTQIFTCTTNTFGKYEMITEYKMLSNVDVEISNQINTPLANRKLYTQVNLKNVENDQSINAKLEFDDKTYQIYLGRQNQQIKIKFNTPIDYLKKISLTIKENPKTYEVEAFYNQNQIKAIFSQNQEIISLTLQSNTEYFKVVSVSIENSFTQKNTKLMKLTLNMNEKHVKMSFEIHPLWRYVQFTTENDLVNYLPKSFSGLIQYSLNPIDIFIELKSNEVSLFNFILNKEQFLFNSKLKLHKIMTTEVKVNITKSKLELILLSDKIFSILITKNSYKEINAKIMINNNQYSLNTIFDITDHKLIFKLSTYKNSIDKFIELNNEIDSKNQFIKLEVSYLKDTIFKLKLINEKLPVRKISIELIAFSFNGVTDVTIGRKSSEINAKLSWNFLYNEEQLHIGSIIFGIKSSRPLNFLIIVNLKKSSYEAQFMEFDSGSFRLKLSSPYKAFNIDIKWTYNNLYGIQELRLSWKNSLTGDYNIKYDLKYHSDPSIKFLLSSSAPIIRFTFHLNTSKPHGISMDTSLKMFDEEIINFDFNLSTKKLVELYILLRTPFQATRYFHIKKTIKYTSIFEHEYETTVIYNGFMKMKYVSGHEIYLTKKIFKLKGSFHTDENQLVSVDINHSGNHNNLNHSFIWHVKDRKFGVKLDGGFRPLFEGKTEIYTPFHKTGKIILMGKQMDKGIFLEAGNRNERLASFEYEKENEVQMMRITLPANYGKPIGVKYGLKRLKRSSGSEIDTEVTYGTDKLFDLSSKIETKNNEYNALFNLKLPKLTEKTAELLLKHNYNDKTWNFDHQLKIKDAIFKVYRIFGNLFRENSRNFKVSLNTEHPSLGSMHVSFGHSLTPNNYDHHLIVKSNDKNWITHNGNVRYDFDKSKYSGELKTATDSKSLSIGATHSGDWNKFLQSLLMEINDAVYLRYKGDLQPNENSQIEIEFPHIGSSQINLIINSNERRVEFIYKNKAEKYNLEMINKRGKLETTLKLNDENLASLSIGYATIPLFINWKYLKHSGTIEMTLDKSLISLKMESSCMKYKKALLKLTPNKIATELNYMGKPYSIEAEYEYSPNKLVIKLNSSIQSLSVIIISVTSSQIKITFNEFYQSIDFKFTPHQITFISDNNFMIVKKISSELLIETPNKATWKLEINSYSSMSKISFEKEKFIVANTNNYFNIQSIEFEILNQIEKDLKHWTVILNTNNIQTLKFQIQIKDFHYSIGLESYLGQHLVVSYNMPANELIISFKFKENYFNFIQRLTENSNTNSKTIILNTKFESSVTYLHKINNEISYTTRDSDSYLKIASEINKNIYSFSGELSNKKLIANVVLNHLIYSINLTRISYIKLKLELVTPSHQIKMKLEKNDNKYQLDVHYDNKPIVMIITRQNSDIGVSIDHDSIVEFYGQQIWNLKFNSDFKKHSIKMILPRKFDAIITNDWNENEMTKLGVQIKFDINGKPIEFGAGISFLITRASNSIEIQMENSYHVIKWKKTVNKTTEKQTSIGLLNKITKNQWELIITTIKDRKFELLWKTPSEVKEIKYYQEIVNNVRTAIDLDLFGKFKFNLKSKEKNSNQWSGALSLFSTKIARIEVGENFVEAFINEGSEENKKIYLKWTKLNKGKWKQDYVKTEQLIIVQKALNINIEIVQELIMKNTVYSSLTTIKYQQIDGSMKTFKCGASLDITENNKIAIELVHPFLSIKTFIIRSQPNKSILKYKMESYINEINKISGYFLIKTDSNPGLSAQLNYNPQDESEFLHLHMKFIDDRQAETIIYIEKKQLRTTFLQLLLRLLNEHHIESTFQMKSNILSKFSETVKQYKSDFQMKYVEFLINQQNWITKEVQNRYKQIISSIPNYSTLENQLSIFSRKIREEMKSLSNELLEMLKKNEFYFNTILRTTLKHLAMRSSLIRTVKQIILSFETVQIKFIKIVQYFARGFLTIRQQFQYLALRVADYIVQPVIDSINNYFFMYFPRFQNFIINRLETIKITFDKYFFKSLSISIQIKKFTKLFILGNIYKILDKTTELIKYVLRPLMSGSIEFFKHEEDIKVMYTNMIKILENLSKEILKKIDAIMNQADENMNFLTGDKFFQTLGNSVSVLSGYMIDQLKDEDNQKNARALIYSVIIYPFRDIQRKIEEFTMNLIWPNYMIINDIQDLEINSDKEIKIIVKYTSPIPFRDFKSLPDFGYVTKKINKVKSILYYTKKMFESQFSNGYKYFEMKNWFIFYFPKPSFSILPEFENYATISKRSVLTFDKKSFTLKSDPCRVLLSKDIKLNKWEIIMNQHQNRQFYTINIGSNSLELSSSDYKVKLNGKPIDLPIQFGSTSLVGLGRMMKLKDEKLGLTITADPTNEMFTVGVSGWYHGKVRGLFGNSDNEPFNDFMLDNSKIVKSDVFMKAYNFQEQNCNIEEEEKLTVQLVKGCPFLRRLVCKFLYKCPFSPLASCFSKVDPKHFYELCVQSSDKLLTKLDPSVCNSARQYQAQCHKAGVEIPVPLPCQKCEVKNDKPLSINEFRNIKIKEKASDIIFIIDEGNCLNSLQNKLPNIVSELDKEMQTKGITSVNYGLVTFVDDYYNTANFHTVGQKLFGSNGELLQSLKNLKLSNGKYKDIVGSIQTASGYPFREHASRHIVMISCGSTKEYPVAIQTLSDRLKQKAIQFSLLTDFSFKLKDENKKSIIFGVDQKNIYTPLSRNGDKNLTTRPQNDFLYQLTMQMKGVVFDYKFMTVNQDSTRQRFVSSLANQISHRATPARSSKCTCVDDGEYNCIPLDTHTIFPVKRS